MISPGRRAFLALVGAASGLGTEARAQTTPKRGGILRVAAPTNPSSLDPVTGTAGSDHVYLYTLYDTLVEWEPATLEPRPGLATAWSFPDPLTMVLELRSGVVFHDGTSFDANAVKFNLDRARGGAMSNVKPDLASVRDVRVTGPLQVTLDLTQPDTALPLILSDRAGMIVSPAAATERGARLGREPVGSGPWKFVSWSDNEKVIVARHGKYWKPGLPYVDGIEIATIVEVSTGLRSVVAGQNDFVFFLSPQQKAIIDRAKNLVPVTGPTLWCVQIYLNYGRKPLNDVRVRQALNHAIDRDAFNKATANGLAEPAHLMLPASHWAYDKDAASLYPYDPEKARRLLAEAGYKDGFELDIQGTSDQRAVQREEVLIEQLQKSGIRAKFTNGIIPSSTTAFFVEKKHDAYLSTWTGRPDPTQTYQLLFGKDAFYNAGRADPVPELAWALTDTRKDQGIPERKRAFARLQKLVFENALVVPLQFQFEMDAHTSRLKGFQPNLLGKARFEAVWFDS